MKKKTFDNKMILFLQCWGILLVVAGHAFVEPEKRNFVKDFIYSFHMPLFFSISGYLFMSKLEAYKERSGRFISNKARALLIPYLFISVLSYTLKAFFNRYSLRAVEVSFSDFVHGLIYPWDNSNVFLWYLPTLFILFVFFIGIGRVYSFRHTGVNVLLAIGFIALSQKHLPIDIRLTSATFLNYTGCLLYALPFFVGMMLCCYQPVLARFLKRRQVRWVILLLSLSALVYLVYFRVRLCLGDSHISLYVVRMLLGLIFSWSLAIWMRHFSIKPIAIIGQYSYQIYLLSWFAHQSVIVVCWKMLRWEAWVCYALGFALGLLFPIGVSAWAKKYIKRDKLLMLIGL